MKPKVYKQDQRWWCCFNGVAMSSSNWREAFMDAIRCAENGQI